MLIHSLNCPIVARKMEVSTDEYIMDEVAKSLNLNPNRFGLLAALLGNHLLTRKDLRDFHHQLAPELRDPKCKVRRYHLEDDTLVTERWQTKGFFF